MDTRYERQLKRGVLEIVVLKLLSQGRCLWLPAFAAS